MLCPLQGQEAGAHHCPGYRCFRDPWMENVQPSVHLQEEKSLLPPFQDLFPPWEKRGFFYMVLGVPIAESMTMSQEIFLE